jgi:hypothetical protein
MVHPGKISFNKTLESNALGYFRYSILLNYNFIIFQYRFIFLIAKKNSVVFREHITP